MPHYGWSTRFTFLPRELNITYLEDVAAAPLAAVAGLLPILATRPTTVVMTARVSAAPSSATVSSDHASPPLPEWDEEDCRRSSSVCDEPSITAKCCEDS